MFPSLLSVLLAGVSHVVVEEARRQLNLIFGPSGPPKDLITVQIRWGDKKREMKLVDISGYIEAVRKILQNLGRNTTTASVFLATEDPRAVEEFRENAPSEWNVYVDAYFEQFLPHRQKGYNGNPHMSKQLGGSPGLVALASILVAMEANDFVLTTASNWSRLMNELRKNVLQPRLERPSELVDLRPHTDGKFAR